MGLTSKDAKQYQQKTCLQRLHIIWAQPSSFSIGTLHMGQHLMRSESKGMLGSMRSVCPSFVRRLVFSSQENPECQGFLQFEQKSDEQVGQWTLWGRQRSTGPQTLHTVSHPARGHHVLLTSRSTSVETRKNNVRTLEPPSWRTTPCRSSAAAYSIYSQPPSIAGGHSSIRYPRMRQGTHLTWWCCIVLVDRY
jgi:hypothetical protein